MDGYPDGARLDLPGGPHEAPPVTLVGFAQAAHERADEQCGLALMRLDGAYLTLAKTASISNTTALIVLAAMVNGLLDAMETAAKELPR